MTSAASSFSLPDDYSIYIDKIKERCEDLISHNIWEGVSQIKLNQWLSNFETDEEQYFSACLLDSLIFRSEAQTISLIKQLFQRVLPDLNRVDPMPIGKIKDWLKAVNKNNGVYPLLRFVSVVQETDPPTKSAYIIARYMKRDLHVAEELIIKPWEINNCLKNGIKMYIFIDDFLGSGDQFNTLLENSDLTKQASLYVAYTPLVVHEKGCKFLKEEHPNLRLRGVESLDKSHMVFHDESNCFNDGVNTPEGAKNFYYELLKKKKIEIFGEQRNGYGTLELAYVFNHAVPDNCLPIFYWDKNPEWKPLFDR